MEFLLERRAIVKGSARMVARKSVYKDKKEGGLGVKDLTSMNDALASKWWWRLFIERELHWNTLIRTYNIIRENR